MKKFLLALLILSNASYAGMGQNQMPEYVEGGPLDSEIFENIADIFQPRNAELEDLVSENKIFEALDYYNQAAIKNNQENEQRDEYIDFDKELLLSLSKKANSLIENKIEYKNLFEEGEQLKESNFDNWQQISKFMDNTEVKLNEYNNYKIFDDYSFRSSKLIKLEGDLNEIRLKLTENLQANFYDYYQNNPEFLNDYPLSLNDNIEISFSEQSINNLCSSPAEKIEKFRNEFSNLISYSDSSKFNQCILAKKIDATDSFEEFYTNIQASLDNGDISSVPKELLTIVKISPKNTQEFSYNLNTSDIFYVTHGSLDKLDLIDAKYKVLIVPKNSNYRSKTTKRDMVNSRYHLRTDRYPNPKYAIAQNELYNAQQDSTRRAIENTQPKNYGYGAAGAIGAILDGILTASVKSDLTNAQAALNSTPQYIAKPVYQDYQYRTSEVRTEKSFDADIYVVSDDNSILGTSFKKINQENFNLAFDVHPNDNSNSYHNSQEDIDAYQKQSFDFELNELLAQVVESKELKKVKSFKVMENKIAANNNIKHQSKKIMSKTKVDERFNSVVVVLSPDGSIGTGFYVAPNLVVTNNHVVEGAKFLEIKKYDGTMSFGKVVKVDIDRDLALVKVESKGAPVTFYSADQFPLGSQVDAIGHPNKLEFSITRGVVSALREIDLARSGKKVMLIQTDTPINPGNSGGPLFYKGELIGVNVMKQVANDTEGLGFAIHLNETLDFLGENYNIAAN